MISGNLNFLEPSEPLQACNGTILPFYCGTNSLACYMFQPPIVAIFRKVFFEEYITQNVKTIYKYKIPIKVFVLNYVHAVMNSFICLTIF
jgi:hypothetical protein